MRRNSGAFLISREIFESDLFYDVTKFRLFFLIVGKAVFSHKGTQIGSVKLKRGQFLRSYRNLRDDLEYIENNSVKTPSLSTIKNKVEELKKEGRIETEETQLGTLFTVLNYDNYQQLDNYKTETKNTEQTDEEHSSNVAKTEREQNVNNNKYVKNDKNVKNDNKENVRKTKYRFSDDHFKLTDFLISEIQNNIPDFKKTEREKERWSNEFRLLNEKGGKSLREISAVIKYAQRNGFWMSKIMSADSVRRNYDQLYLELKNSRNPKNNNYNKRNDEVIPEWFDKRKNDKGPVDESQSKNKVIAYLEKEKAEIGKDISMMSIAQRAGDQYKRLIAREESIEKRIAALKNGESETEEELRNVMREQFA